MTRDEVRGIAQEVVNENNSLLQSLLEVVPKVRTQQVCKILGVKRSWVSKNKHLLGGKRINLRLRESFSFFKCLS